MPDNVRFAQHRDLVAVEQIENDADRLLIDWLGTTDWAAAPTGAARQAERGFLLVIETDDDHVVGFVHVLEVDDICHLEQLSVRPANGRQGRGRTLLEAAKQQASERGYHQISLRTYADVPWNAPFYATAGFVQEEPTTAFHRLLVDFEADVGLDRYGRRVQMVAPLDARGPSTTADGTRLSLS